MYLLCPLSSGCCNPDSLLHLWTAGTLLLQPGEVPHTFQPLQIPTDPPPSQEVGARTAPGTHTCFSLSWVHLHPETSFSESHWMVSVFMQSESPSRGQHTSPGTCVQQEIWLPVEIWLLCHNQSPSLESVVGLDQEHSRHLSMSVHPPPKT